MNGRIRSLVVGVAVALAMAPLPPTPIADASEQACPIASLPPTDFADAHGVHGVSIHCLAWYGLTEGQRTTEFGTHEAVRRGHVATLLLNVLRVAGADLPRPEGTPFPDAVGTTHQDAIERLAAAGVFRGTPEGEARPHVAVTREQFAAFVVRGVEVLEGEPLPTGPHGFLDVDGAHADVVGAAVRAGFVRGVSVERFEPSRVLDRGQSASVLVGLLERFVAHARVDRPADPTMAWEVARLSATTRTRMTGTSWHPECPVALDELREIRLTHRGFDDRLHFGELIAHHDAVDDLRAVFTAIYDHDFPLQSVIPAHRFDGDDDAIMAANNSHAFNCRRITGGSSWSEHSRGATIDLNPVQNPYERGTTVLPPAGRTYLDRSDRRPGMLLEGDPVIEAVDRIGWVWGGRWSSPVDSMHIER